MKRKANAHWKGTLEEGQGELNTQSAVLTRTSYSFKTRFAGAIGTNPEELLAAAHAGCFTMAVSAILGQHNFVAGDLDTTAEVEVDVQTLSVTGIHLELKADRVEGLDEALFTQLAEGAKANCIISKALSVPVTLKITYA
jgi:osmotically inducible protein OsmC